MKLAEALEIIRGDHDKEKYRVAYEKRKNGMLYGACFPSPDESPFVTFDEADIHASHFAAKAPDCFVNIYVINAKSFEPISTTVYRPCQLPATLMES